MRSGMAVVAVLVVCIAMYLGWCNRPNNGIHTLGKNVCLLEGTSITINWDATELEVELALRRWQELKK